MALTHTDPEVQEIFTLLEGQRDAALLSAGRSAIRVRALEAMLAEATKAAADATAAAAEAAALPRVADA